jgi:ubiquinone/menaquinone biosynthesis C-methylase UbiE
MSDRPSDALRDVYERRAELEYAAPAAATWYDPKFERVWELVAERLPCRAFLDAGCGHGRYLAALAAVAQPPGRVAGTDISERILEIAGREAERAGVEAELVRANLESLPFEDGSFDLVLCSQVVEHLLAPERGLAELARILRPGGTLIVSTDNERNLVTRALNAPRSAVVRLLGLRGRRRKVSFPHRAFAVSAFEELVRSSGLALEHVETFRFHLDPPFDSDRARRVLRRIDAALPAHFLGDIIAVVATKPR